MACSASRFPVTQRPLIVDLDGSLIRSDLLVESALAYVKAKPLRIFDLLTWLLKGRANLKAQLAQAVTLSVPHLPYNTEIQALMAVERAAGRQVVLATSSHRIFADQVAAHLGAFDDVIATENGANLSGQAKRDELVRRYGEKGFDYVGNSSDDLPVWQAARQAYAVNPPASVLHKAQALGNLTKAFRSDISAAKVWMRTLRLHQWTKNFLVFVPLLASHKFTDIALIADAFLAFFVFGLCASSVYIVNDILDLDDDRQHATKVSRTFAAGHMSLIAGVVAFPLLLILAFGLSAMYLPWKFTAVLAAYYALTAAYSLGLKRITIVDVTMLAMLYTMRIIAGVFAVDVLATFWMLAFSMFIFFSFALVKRFTELRSARQQGVTGKTPGRGYYPDDIEMISALGASSGYIAVLVLAMYINDSSTLALYRHPEFIWFACPLLLFWISRLWLLTHRGLMHDDPVIFAIKDRTSWIVGVLFGCVFWLAA